MSPYSDKDRPSTWKKFREGMCTGCSGGCCTMPVEVRVDDLIRMGVATEDDLSAPHKKLARRLISEKIVKSYRAGTGLFTLAQRANDDCIFLDVKSRLCTIYEKRPDVCRKFPSIGPRPGYCPHHIQPK